MTTRALAAEYVRNRLIGALLKKAGDGALDIIGFQRFAAL
jgi:hypothetical protein